MKQCKTCGELKSLGEYFNSKNNAGGKVPHCKPCMRNKENKEIRNACSKRYRDRYPEKRLERDKKYRAENSEKIKAMRNIYLERRYKTDPIYKLQTILRQQIVDYIKHDKSKRTAELLGYTAEEFILRHGEGNIGDHIDHRIPKSWFTDNTPINIIWHLDNLQWLDSAENESKGNRYMHQVPDNYLQQILPYIKEEFVILLKK